MSASANQCCATTRKGTPCPIEADRKTGGKSYCHVHDPSGKFKQKLRDKRAKKRRERQAPKLTTPGSADLKKRVAELESQVAEMQSAIDWLTQRASDADEHAEIDRAMDDALARA